MKAVPKRRITIQIDTQLVLDMAEETGQLAFFDIEASNLKADYGSIICASVRPFGGKPITFKVDTVGRDKTLVKNLRDCLEGYTIISGYYSKGFDVPMIRSRLLIHGMRDLSKRHHLDLYFTLKSKMLTSRKSQGHLLAWLGAEQQKMTVSADVWSQVAADPKKHIPHLVRRCESDVAGLEALYLKTRHLIGEITK